MDFGGTIKSYKETFKEDDCPERVTLKFIALMALINSKDSKTFSAFYHFLTDTKSKVVLNNFFKQVNTPLTKERRF